MTTIADVAFDVPLAHSFAYRVPDGWTPAPGQRVVAPLRGASRVGMIGAPRDGAHRRLARLGHAVRLDSGVPDAERVAAWDALRDGSARLAAGTRSALLAPLVAPATLVLIDEHEAAHKPPGPPRIHSRDVAFERAARERLTLLLTSATPSVEAWRRAEAGLVG